MMMMMQHGSAGPETAESMTRPSGQPERFPGVYPAARARVPPRRRRTLL